jgi:hypothetical protein
MLIDPISSAIKGEQQEISQFLPKYLAFLMAREEATDGYSNLADAVMDVSQMVKTMLERAMETVQNESAMACAVADGTTPLLSRHKRAPRRK